MPPSLKESGPSERPPFALAPVLRVAALLVAIQALCLTRYGWFRDELYYLSCSHRLAWGYVDHPPLSIGLLAVIRMLAGDSLAAMRAVAALASAAVAVTAALLARELRGRTFAQVTAALAVGLAPMSLGVGHIYSMNVFDFLVWALASWQLLRVLERPSSRGWLALGFLLGLGLLNKWSVLWLGGGIAVTLLLTPARAQLRQKGPWLAAALAAAMFAPNLLWEVRQGWPTLEFMHNARTQKMVALEPLSFLLDLVLAMGPGGALIWVVGLVAALARARSRPLGVIFLITLAILFASGSARTEYAALACPALFAVGAVFWESRPRPLRLAVVALAVLLAIPIAPLALPVLPIDTYLAYQTKLHREPHSEERHRMGLLPQQYADMFGWPELADSVAKAAARLAPSERDRAIVVVDNYGEAGALEHFGAGRIPTIACQHVNWYLWGPPAWDGRTAILLGRDSSEVAGEFAEVHVVGRAGHRLAMPYEQALPIVIARGFRPDFKTAWAKGRHYQ